MTCMRIVVLAALVGALPVPPTAAGLKIDSNTFGGLRARDIGPATMSGRVSAIDGVPGPPLTLWVGAASGGVWKSEDGGVTFEAVFDDHPQSIGAIRVDPSDPEVVWVGTGETWVRNSVSVGRGVYRTRDGGDTWEHLGLEDSERIAKIAVHPEESDTVWVCATGHLWSANEERGVFKTTDGGKSWTKVLYVDEDTGCADLDLDPQDPSIVFASMWQFRRSPDFFDSGGPGSGLYKSTDGGESWRQLEKGLPEGELGRIAVAIAPSRTAVVYAMVEAEEKRSALYRSDDLGESWEKRDSSSNMIMRPFYFAELAVDPVDFNRIYKPGFVLTVSTDGGESFSSLLDRALGGGYHPDLHALWINPENPREMALGTDGGLYISQDRGRAWRYVRRLPISQFYHVSVDLEMPYNVYGGLQDNGSWKGPSRKTGGIRNRDWKNIGFGDGFWAFADPQDANTLYVEYQGGNIFRIDLALGTAKSIRPYPAEGQEKLRFNWNTPIHLSPSRPGTLYVGSQHLHRSTDRGESWESISPDLTTDDPEKQRQEESGGLTIDNSTAENHCTIFTIGESPLNADVVWAGTDDGRLHVTRDGGESWTEVSGNLPDLPPGTWVSKVAPGLHAEGTVFATFDGHRTGDMNPHVYRSDDFGGTWISLVGEGLDGYAHVIAQDPVNPELLYLGTEMGLYISLDGGGQWARFKENLPPVSVQDLAVHPREHDLVVATHGRGVYIIDDLTPLRNLTAEILEESVALIPSRPSPMIIASSLGWMISQDEFVGENPPEAAVITYYQKKRHLFGDLKVEIYDAEGELIRTLPGKKRAGLNRVVWPMRLPPPKVPPAVGILPAFTGPRVLEGTYRVKLIKGKTELEGEVSLVADPRSPYSAEDRLLQQRTALEIYDMLEDMAFLVDSLNGLKDGARERAEGLKDGERTARKVEEFADGLEEMRKTLVATREGAGISGEEQLRERLGALYGSVNGYEGRPTDSQLDRLASLGRELEEATAAYRAYVDEHLETVNAALGKEELAPLEPLSREAWEAEGEGAPSSGVAAGALWPRLEALLHAL